MPILELRPVYLDERAEYVAKTCVQKGLNALWAKQYIKLQSYC